MNKRHLHHTWTKIRPLSPWYLLALALIFGVISVLSMRQNNLTMVNLRNNVFAADKQNGDVETALRELRQFIYSHMNTNLNSATGIRPPIQLKYRYDRLLQAEKARVSAINAKINKDAERSCLKQFPTGFGGIPCIKTYIGNHTVKEQSIPDDLYKFDFVSPKWTPDLAGWSLLAALFLFGLFVLRYGLELWVKHDLRQHM